MDFNPEPETSMHAGDDQIFAAMEAGASAFVGKDAPSTEVVKAAEARARQVVEKAEDHARRMRLECEDFCDQKLASFEMHAR